MTRSRAYYLLEYPAGLDREKPVYPYTLTVHRYKTWQHRNEVAAVERMRNIGSPPRWIRVSATDPRVKEAKRVADNGNSWPIRLRIKEEQPVTV